MIKANELRIGNWIKNKIDTYVKVLNIQEETINQIFDEDGVVGSYRIDFFEPIPLTPEVLGKCGFVIVNHIYGYSFYTMDSKSKKDKLKPNIDIYEHTTHFMGRFVNHCQYVHQLQNLYFALTGEELTVNF